MIEHHVQHPIHKYSNDMWLYFSNSIPSCDVIILMLIFTFIIFLMFLRNECPTIEKSTIYFGFRNIGWKKSERNIDKATKHNTWICNIQIIRLICIVYYEQNRFDWKSIVWPKSNQIQWHPIPKWDWEKW